jgi:hypothetical protein
VLLAVIFSLAIVDSRLILLRIFPGVALVTLAVFVWELLQAMFVRELDPGSRGIALFCVGVTFDLIRMVMAQLKAPHNHIWIFNHLWTFSIFTYAFVRAAQFDMRRSLEAHYNSIEPLGLQLNPVLLLLFGTYYLQYHFHEIATLKRATA